MKTNNEKWQGSSKFKSNSGAGRDGKSFDKRDVKSILKGSHGAPKFGGKENRSEEKPSYDRNADKRPAFGEKRSFEIKGDRPAYGERRPFESRGDRPSYGEKRSFESRGDRPSYGEKRSFDSRGDRPAYGERRSFESRGDRPAYGERKSFNSRPQGPKKPWEDRFDNNGEKVYGRSQDSTDSRPGKLSFKKPGDATPGFIETRFDNRAGGTTFRKPVRKSSDNYDPNSKYSQKKQHEFKKNSVDMSKPVRLNKFLANAGICSRREADEYIQAGVILVNGEVVTQMGVKVLPTDKVMFHNQPVRSERKVYLLLNKPKDCVTTSEDTHDRLTVLDLVKNACSERIYPVGRLDRNTTGVLLLTNDGDLASKLTHPKYEKKKIYHATLDKPLQEEDYNTILSGVVLDDESIAADALEYVKPGDLKQVGIEIHSGQNRVVRRIFEKLGYKVVRLDRVCFAGLTKKNLGRGKYRFLTEKEVNILKMGAHE